MRRCTTRSASCWPTGGRRWPPVLPGSRVWGIVRRGRDGMLFVIKQIVGLLGRPGFVALLLAVTALALRARGSRTPARCSAVAAIAVAYFGSLGVVGNALLAPLEQRYAALADEAPLPDVAHIVVLGSGYVPRGSIPVTAALSADGLARVVEGIRLKRRVG